MRFGELNHLSITTPREWMAAFRPAVLAVLWLCACTPVAPTEDGNGNVVVPLPVWRQAFDTSNLGNMSGVWGSGPDDVFVVGGMPDRGEVVHFDGSTWSTMQIPPVSLLVWVYGFGPDNVIAVGEDGAAIHYDGDVWRQLDTGIDQALWGVWGSNPQDVWIVGGDVGEGEPVILRYDGATFTAIEVPPNDRAATSLFKVWGIGEKVFAVGERGLVLEFADDAWVQVPAGAEADDDFVSLWGTSENNIAVAGGRGIARISVYGGQSFDTMSFSSVPGLNAVFGVSSTEFIVGGQSGYVATFDPSTGELIEEISGTTVAIHAAWGDGAGHVYAVGGMFAPPHTGVALVRSIDGSGSNISPGFDTSPDSDVVPDPDVTPDCTVDDVCSNGFDCIAGACVEAVGVRMDLGIMDQSTFVRVEEGGDMPLFFGFQGSGSHIFASLELTGISPDANAEASWRATRISDGELIATADGFDARLSQAEGASVVLIQNQFIFFTAEASDIDGERIELTFTITDTLTDEVVAEVTREVIVRL